MNTDNRESDIYSLQQKIVDVVSFASNLGIPVLAVYQYHEKFTLDYYTPAHSRKEIDQCKRWWIQNIDSHAQKLEDEILTCIKKYGPIGAGHIAIETGYDSHAVDAAAEALIRYGLLDVHIDPPLYTVKEPVSHERDQV